MRVGVQTLLIAVAGLSAIAIAVSGCTGDSDAEAESTPATTTGQVETQPAAQSAVNISKFRAAFRQTFGERPWYREITRMKMANRTLVITTTLDPREIDVGTFCEAAFTVAHNLAVRDVIEAVRVVASDGRDGGCA